MITRREILQVGVATAALAAGDSPFTRVFAQQRLTEGELLKFDALGNVTLLHVADIHGHITRPSFGGIEGDNTDWIVIVAREEIADQRLAISMFFVGFAPR